MTAIRPAVVVIILLLSSAAWCSQPVRLIHGERVVAASVHENDYSLRVARTYLTVSRDHRIGVWLEIQNGEHRKAAELVESLGYALEPCQASRFARVVPDGEVITIARRITLHPGEQYWVLVTWGLSQFTRNVAYNIYVLRQASKSLSVLYRAGNVAPGFRSLFTADWDGDGEIEVVDLGRDGSLDYLTVRSLKNGEVVTLQRFSRYSIQIDDRYEPAHPRIFVEDKPNPCLESACPARREEYRWSSEQRKLVPVVHGSTR